MGTGNYVLDDSLHLETMQKQSLSKNNGKTALWEKNTEIKKGKPKEKKNEKKREHQRLTECGYMTPPFKTEAENSRG